MKAGCQEILMLALQEQALPRSGGESDLHGPNRIGRMDLSPSRSMICVIILNSGFNAEDQVKSPGLI